MGVRVLQVLERLLLSAGQVAGVLQDRVLWRRACAHGLLVPSRLAWFHRRLRDLSERVGHPGDDVEPVQYAFGVRAALGDARVDPAGPVAGDDLDGGALFGRQRLEEQVEHVPTDPVVRPDDPMPLVVDDHRDARMAFAVVGPVHADRRQPVERRGHRRLDAFGDPDGRRLPRGPPRDMKETADRLPVRDSSSATRTRLEIPGEPAARPRPRHGRRPRRVSVQ